jgi:2'-5' RNA ligase
MFCQRHATLPSEIRDYPEWHRGRHEYALWLIELENEEVSEKINAAQEHLSDFLLTPYHRQPHITTFVCGFLADSLRFDDDYSLEQFHVHAQFLNDANVKPFFVEIGGLSSFASAPFLEVDDLEGGIGRLRSVLSATGKEIARSVFTPHITIGLYSEAFPSTVVNRKISAFPTAPNRFKVERITFATYKAQELGGALTFRHEVSFR